MPELIVRKWDGPYSFMVFREEGLYKARRGDNGSIQFQDPELHEVLNDVWNALTPGRTWKEKVVLKGDFTLTSGVELVSNLILDLSQARIKGQVKHDLFFSSVGVSDVEIYFGEVDCQGAYGTPLGLYNSQRILVKGGYIHDVNLPPNAGYGLYFEDCDYLWVENVHIKNVQSRDMIEVRACHHAWVINPLLENGNRYGIDCHASDTPRYPFDIHIIHPVIIGCKRGIDIQDGDHWEIVSPVIMNLTEAEAIDLRGTLNYVDIISPQIYNLTQTGINDYDAVAVNDLRIIGGIIDSITGTNMDAVYLEHSPGALICGLHTRNAARRGFYIKCNECKLIGVKSENNGSDGIFLEADYCRVIDSDSKDNEGWGIREYTGHDYNIIKNNRVTGNTAGDISTVGANTIVRDNIS